MVGGFLRILRLPQPLKLVAMILLKVVLNTKKKGGERYFNNRLELFYILQVVEDGYEFFAKRQLVTLFSAPNYCGEFDNAGAMMSVDETLMCSFQV